MNLSSKERVVVTGMGAFTPLGPNVSALWQNMLNNKTGISVVDLFDITGFRTTVGGLVDKNSLAESCNKLNVPPHDPSVQMAVLAADEALSESGLVVPTLVPTPLDIPVIVGTGAGCNQSFFDGLTGFAAKKVRGLRPTTVPRCLINAAPALISMQFKLTGTNYSISSACASATTAIGNGFRMIRDGYSSQALCCGTEMPFTPFAFGAWNNLRIMSKNPDPAAACRPFAADRDGMVIGEGAGALLLESLTSAQERGASIRGEIIGFGLSSDATHITVPSTDGQVKAMQNAINSAGLSKSEIGFINAHGTATFISDTTEAKSIRQLFGSNTDSIPAGSNKSFFGHLLGASGAVETIVTLLGLENGQVPANLNLQNPDPKCDINLVGGSPMTIESPIAMKNSFGFGGNNAVLILKRWQQN